MDIRFKRKTTNVMKKVLYTTIILLILSCSKKEEQGDNDCGCIRTQEILVKDKFWTGGAFLEIDVWRTTGETRKVKGCYTDKEVEFMTDYNGSRERWLLNCN